METESASPLGWVGLLPHVNASLNAVATCLLVAGYLQIKRHQETAHQRTMLAAFAVSVLFLASYLTYHALLPGHGRKFPTYPPTAIRYGYWALLLTHAVLAAVVPFMAIASIVLGLQDRRQAHRRLSKWTFPIWLYVSVTGVLVYLMLYQIYPPR